MFYKFDAIYFIPPSIVCVLNVLIIILFFLFLGVSISASAGFA